MAKKSSLFIPVAVAAVALGGAYFYSKAAGYESLNYYPKGFKFTGGLLNPKLTYIMDVVNPTTKTLTLNNIFGNVYVGEKMIGRIEYIQKTFFKTGTTTVGVPVILFSGGVVSALVALLQGANPMLKILGTVNAEGFIVPMNQEIPLTP